MSMTNEEASNILRLLAVESLEGVSRIIESEKNRDLYKRAYEMAIKSLEESVAVVRCKDCKWFNESGCAIRIVDESDKPSENDFCSFGERRSE